jgi:hypothetical protein
MDVNEKDAVLLAHAQNHAVAALLAAKPSCITNARSAPSAARCRRRVTTSWWM